MGKIVNNESIVTVNCPVFSTFPPPLIKTTTKTDEKKNNTNNNLPDDYKNFYRDINSVRSEREMYRRTRLFIRARVTDETRRVFLNFFLQTRAVQQVALETGRFAYYQLHY